MHGGFMYAVSTLTLFICIHPVIIYQNLTTVSQMVINGIPYIGLKAMVVGPGLDNNAYAIASFYKNGSLAIEGFGRQNSLRVPVS